MDSEIIETITEWDSGPFEDGHAELRDLADRRFSGAISDGMAWAFMSNGKLIGFVDGDLDTFSGAAGTVYEAPEPVLPLLCMMRVRGGEERGKYYTEETPIETVNEKLSSGGFTGYLELSENVLSGDYYVVYYGGKAMSVAFVGNSRKLYTDEEAFDRLTNEVGIYTVRSVDVEVTAIPSADPDTSADDSGDSNSEDENQNAIDSDPAETIETADADTDNTATETETDTVADPESTDTTAATESPADQRATADEATTTADESRQKEPSEPADRLRSKTEGDGPAESEETVERSEETQIANDPLAEDTDSQTPAGRSGSPPHSTAKTDTTSSFQGETKWRETRSIPSLDPAKSRSDDNGATSGRTAAQSKSASSTKTVSQSPPAGQSDRSAQNRPRNRSTRDGAEAKLARAKKLYKELKERAERLEAERDSAREERDEARNEADRLKSKVEDLESEIDRLESTVERLEADQPKASDDKIGRSLSATEAIAGTNLFVRYVSKGKTTLEDIHDGDGNQTELQENLRLEKHTTFDTTGCTVEGDSYEEFLTETIQYRFTRWVVEALLFEIIETGNQNGLRDLYDCIPHIDRAEFDGEVELEPAEGEGDEPLTATFDVVLRDRMGEPLLIANFNDSRQPARSGMIESLVRSGKDLCERSDSFGGSIAVTSSFFDPSALEASGDATGGGLLSRNKAKSYVKVGRKLGFHLCLVESRENNFHMSVPEL